MRSKATWVALAVSVVATVSCRAGAVETAAEEIIAIERAALDRWGKGDPQGYLEIMAPEITYFDPLQEKRVDGHDAMVKALTRFTGKIKVSRFDMIAPKVQQHGNVALLTFNLVSYVALPDGKEQAATGPGLQFRTAAPGACSL